MSVAFTGDRPPAVAPPGSRVRLIGVDVAPAPDDTDPAAVTETLPDARTETLPDVGASPLRLVGGPSAVGAQGDVPAADADTVLDLTVLDDTVVDVTALGATPLGETLLDEESLTSGSAAEDAPPSRSSAREDAVLVQRCRRGDADAYAALYRRWYPRCRAAAARVLAAGGPATDAEDLAQEALVIAWSRLDQLRDLPSFGPWVCRISRNLALDHAKRRRPALHPLQELVDDHEAFVVDACDPQRVVADRERDRLVRVAAGSLKGRDEEVFERLVDDGLTPAEVAQALGVTDNHAYQILFRLRNRLQSGLRAALVWRQGRPRCSELADLLCAPGEFTAATAETVVRHLRRCATCAELADEHATPAHLLSGFVAVLLGRLPHGLLRARPEDAVMGSQGAEVVVRVVAGVGVATSLTTGLFAVTGLPGGSSHDTTSAPPRAAGPLVPGAPTSTSRPSRGSQGLAGAQDVAATAGTDPCGTPSSTDSSDGSQVVEAAAGKPARGGKGSGKHGKSTQGGGSGRGGHGRGDGGGDACATATASTSASSSSSPTSSSASASASSQDSGKGRGHGRSAVTMTPGVGRGHAKPHPTQGNGRTAAPARGHSGKSVVPAATAATGDGTTGEGTTSDATTASVATVTVTVTADNGRGHR